MSKVDYEEEDAQQPYIVKAVTPDGRRVHRRHKRLPNNRARTSSSIVRLTVCSPYTTRRHTMFPQRQIGKNGLYCYPRRVGAKPMDGPWSASRAEYNRVLMLQRWPFSYRYNYKNNMWRVRGAGTV